MSSIFTSFAFFILVELSYFYSFLGLYFHGRYDLYQTTAALDTASWITFFVFALSALDLYSYKWLRVFAVFAIFLLLPATISLATTFFLREVSAPAIWREVTFVGVTLVKLAIATAVYQSRSKDSSAVTSSDEATVPEQSDSRYALPILSVVVCLAVVMSLVSYKRSVETNPTAVSAWVTTPFDALNYSSPDPMLTSPTEAFLEQSRKTPKSAEPHVTFPGLPNFSIPSPKL